MNDDSWSLNLLGDTHQKQRKDGPRAGLTTELNSRSCLSAATSDHSLKETCQPASSPAWRFPVKRDPISGRRGDLGVAVSIMRRVPFAPRGAATRDTGEVELSRGAMRSPDILVTKIRSLRRGSVYSAVRGEASLLFVAHESQVRRCRIT